jgi:hypothetical protein
MHIHGFLVLVCRFSRLNHEFHEGFLKNSAKIVQCNPNDARGKCATKDQCANSAHFYLDEKVILSKNRAIAKLMCFDAQ